jgi:hypothetical protein|tara:strand:+ start:1889 stop:2095 length:207 start_codon:yes stop_codon:yes gene_type:complete
MPNLDRNTLRLAVGKDLALEAQAVLAAQGVPMNVTQAVKTLLIFAIQTKHAAQLADRVNYEQTHTQSQ